MNWFEMVWTQIYDTLIYKERYWYIIQGLGNTIAITLVAMIIGVLIGTLVALMKISAASNKKLRPLGWIADIYLTVIRGTPIVVQLMIMYYVILVSWTESLPVAMLAFGINSGAYVAEIIRGGIQSVDKGQVEAGRSLGLSQRTTMIKIVFPQAFKNVLPALGNEFIALLKETSVAGYIGIYDMTKGGDIIRSLTYDAMTSLLTVAVIYLLIVMLMTFGLSKLERRLRKSDIR